MVGLLLERPHHVKELAGKLQLKESTVCHHLAALEKIRLIDMTPKGNSHFYRASEERLQLLGRSIFAERRTLSRAKPDEEYWNQRILNNYLDGELLKTIPASRKKRWEILKWLAGKFSDGKRYRESEVNGIIERHYWDAATLRRELIGYRMLNRDRNIYWRQPEAEWLRA